jgi:Malectin domain
MARAQSSGQVVALNLMQAGSSAIVVANLVEGMVVNLAVGANPNFNIDAITTGSPIASVQFSYNNVTNFRLETAAPYAMCGNVGPIFSQCTPSTVLGLGTHTVGAKTNNGTWFRRTFSIVAAVPPPMSPPVTTPVAPAAPTAFRPILINCGSTSGTTYLDSKGRVWSPDMFFAGGQPFTTQSTWQILGTLDATIYQSERWGAFNYSIPVPPGSYNVTLHLAEIL